MSHNLGNTLPVNLITIEGDILFAKRSSCLYFLTNYPLYKDVALGLDLNNRTACNNVVYLLLVLLSAVRALNKKCLQA